MEFIWLIGIILIYELLDDHLGVYLEIRATELELKTQPVVMYQKRHKISNKHCAEYGEWMDWEECKDIHDYHDVIRLINDGYSYEARELVVKPTGESE